MCWWEGTQRHGCAPVHMRMHAHTHTHTVRQEVVSGQGGDPMLHGLMENQALPTCPLLGLKRHHHEALYLLLLLRPFIQQPLPSLTGPVSITRLCPTAGRRQHSLPSVHSQASPADTDEEVPDYRRKAWHCAGEPCAGNLKQVLGWGRVFKQLRRNMFHEKITCGFQTVPASRAS